MHFSWQNTFVHISLAVVRCCRTASEVVMREQTGEQCNQHGKMSSAIQHNIGSHVLGINSVAFYSMCCSFCFRLFPPVATSLFSFHWALCHFIVLAICSFTKTWPTCKFFHHQLLTRYNRSAHWCIPKFATNRILTHSFRFSHSTLSSLSLFLSAFFTFIIFLYGLFFGSIFFRCAFNSTHVKQKKHVEMWFNEYNVRHLNLCLSNRLEN